MYFRSYLQYLWGYPRWKSSRNMVNRAHWPSGIYYSRNNLFNMSTSGKESYKIYINESISTSKIVLHDTNFFAINSNPVTIPKIIRRGGKGEHWFFQQYLESTEVSKMNLIIIMEVFNFSVIRIYKQNHCSLFINLANLNWAIYNTICYKLK